MRIALLCTDPELITGDGRRWPVRLRGLALALARAGHDVTMLCAGADADAAAAESGVRVRTLRMPVSVREIDWHFSQIEPDVVLERLMPGSLEGVRAAGEAGIPHVYDIEGDLSAGGLATSTSVRGALPEALALTRGAITTSPNSGSRLRELMDGDRPVAVVTNAAGAEFLEAPAPELVQRAVEQLCLPACGVRVGFFGDLHADSGLLPLVEAVATLPSEQGARLVVIGDGEERNPALRVADRTHTRLVLCGRVPHRAVPAHLALCDVVVTGGGDDGGTPLALLESMALQRAVVAPATDGVRGVATPGYDARLVSPSDGAELAQALTDLVADAPQRTRLGARARETVRAGHTWDSRAASVTALLEELRGVTDRERGPWRDQGARSAIGG